VKILYADGGQHRSFGGTALAYAGGSGTESLVSVAANGSARSGGLETSRPEAIGAEQHVPIGADGKPLKQTPKPVMVALNQSTPAKPVAKPAQATVMARASTLAPAQADAAPEEKSMFGRLLGAVGLGGASAAPQVAQEESIPLPPRRNQRAGAPAKSAFAQSQ
jgi:hypothetical protein